MMLSGFFFLLILIGGSSFNFSENANLQQQDGQDYDEGGSSFNFSEKENLQQTDNEKDWSDACTYRDVLKSLNLTSNNENSMIQPGDVRSPTKIKLDVLLYSILDVNEKDQKFVSYIWIDMFWKDDGIKWNGTDFCGTWSIYLPTKLLWMPDLTIEEMTEKDNTLPSLYVRADYNGDIVYRNSMVVVSTCKMEVYKFPFDVQSCTLTFKSAIHSADNIKLDELGDSSWNSELSHEMMTQTEWLFINMATVNETVNNFGFYQSRMVYTIRMRRRSALYITNFLLPVLFFFCLDLTSFLISDSGGEKLGFKVTVLLAVTVMQLILNEILPSSSDKIPLIAIYCIGIFGLMMLSLLETMLVMYLIEKDSAAQDDEADKDQSLSEDSGDKPGKANCCIEMKKWTPCASVCNVSADEPPSELLSVAEEGSSSQLTEESSALEKVSGELSELEKTLILILNSKKEDGKPGYWTRIAKIINRVFFIFYVTVAILFLVVMFSMWNNEDE